MTEERLEKAKLKLKEKGLDFIGMEESSIYSKDEFGYKYSHHISKVISGNFTTSHKYGKPNPFKFENMDITLNERNPYGSKIDYDSYSDSTRDSMNFTCGHCGKVFKLGLHDFFKSEYRVCKYCYHDVQEKNRLDISQVKREVVSFGFKPLFDEYKGLYENLKIMDSEGYIGEICLSSIRRGSKISKFATYNNHAIYNLRKHFKQKEIDLEIPDQPLIYDRERRITLIKVICSCGEEYIVDIYRLTGGQDRCAKCSGSQSSLETSVERHLGAMGLKYNKQHRFKDCRNKEMLPFDFYVHDFGLIESDGEGHYRPVKFNGVDIERAKKIYNKTKKNDEIKNKYCEENNIRLLRIPYWEFEDDTYKNSINQWLGVAN